MDEYSIFSSEESLIAIFGKSIVNSSFDTAIDWGEICIDSLFDEGFLKEIPIIKTVLSVRNVYVSVRDILFCRRIIAFIQELKKDSISQDEIRKHLESISNDKKMKKELEVVLQYIDLYTKEYQSKILARMYYDFIQGVLSWEMFDQLAEVNRRMIVADYSLLRKIAECGVYENPTDEDAPIINRLCALGLSYDLRVKGPVRVTEDYVDKIKISYLGGLFGKYTY